MDATSMVSRARTALNSAAAKAERVFTDITKPESSPDVRIDLVAEFCDVNSDYPDDSGESKCHGGVVKATKKLPHLKTKPDWQVRLRNFGIGKKGAEEFENPDSPTMAFAIFDENLYLVSTTKVSESRGSETDNSIERISDSDKIAPAAVLKQLAVAVGAGEKLSSIRDLLACSRDASPVRERAISAMKSLVLREKEEDKFTVEFGGDEKVISLINSLLDAEGQFPWRNIDSGLETLSIPSLHKELHGAPPHSFVVKLSEVIGSFKTLRKMALFWYKVVSELRRLWSEGHYIPGIPPDDVPDLNSCLLYQHLQVINCCISRKKRRYIATEALEFVVSHADSNPEDSAPQGCAGMGPVIYARISTGELVIRLGADQLADNLMLLETGEPVYAPIMQEGPLFTEDLIKETEELVLRTGSVGAGCSQLLSDMQGFKAANPGCILEDFVRWHSPPDWTKNDPDSKAEDTFDNDDILSARGQLSSRMQKEGNLWRELWETAKPIPAMKQAPLFDEDLAVEGVLNFLEDFPPFELFEQLFVSLLGSGFVGAEGKLSKNESLSKLFFECKDYVVATCQGSNWTHKIDDICQVYETVETMLVKPEEVVKMMNHTEETTPVGESKPRFRKLRHIFGSNEKNLSKLESTFKDSEDNNKPHRKSFPFLFSKKPPRPDTPSPPGKPACPLENDWTVV